MDTCGHILTEATDFLDTESSDRLVTECFVAPTAAAPALLAIGMSGLFIGGTPKKKKKKPYPEDEIEEEEIDELLSMLGIEL